MRVVHKSRDRDIEVLIWLKFRSRGCSLGEASKIFQHPKRCISVATSNVMKADLIESGEPAKIVAKGYWH